jgi:uncharacterized protein (TIGR00369 family)
MPDMPQPGTFPSRETLLSMSGMEFMQAMLAGTMSPSGIWQVMGFRLHGVAAGNVTFRGSPDVRHANPVGAVHGGWYGTLLDSAMGCAVMTAVPRGKWYTTLEYKVSLIRPVAFGAKVQVTGLLDHCGRSTAVAHGEIRGLDDDRLHATGTTTCILLD